MGLNMGCGKRKIAQLRTTQPKTAMAEAVCQICRDDRKPNSSMAATATKILKYDARTIYAIDYYHTIL